MRKFVCVSCGKQIEVNHCSGQRGRDINCPECGSRVYREDSPGSRRAAGGNNMVANAGSPAGAFVHERRDNAGSRRCRGRGGQQGGRQGGRQGCRRRAV